MSSNNKENKRLSQERTRLQEIMAETSPDSDEYKAALYAYEKLDGMRRENGTAKSVRVRNGILGTTLVGGFLFAVWDDISGGIGNKTNVSKFVTSLTNIFSRK